MEFGTTDPGAAAIVNGAAVLTLVGIAWYVSRGGTFIDSWLLALGPCVGYTFNLLAPLIPIVNVGNVTAVGLLALAAGLAVSGVLTAVGYAVGQVFRTGEI